MDVVSRARPGSRPWPWTNVAGVGTGQCTALCGAAIGGETDPWLRLGGTSSGNRCAAACGASTASGPPWGADACGDAPWGCRVNTGSGCGAPGTVIGSGSEGFTGRASADLRSAVEGFVGDTAYWVGDGQSATDLNSVPLGVLPEGDRDDEAVRAACTRGLGELSSNLPSLEFMNRDDMWGGGIRRMLAQEATPRRHDEHWYAPRYLPIGFARYERPYIDPADYLYYQMAGWRVAIPRNLPGPERRNLLRRIYTYGPGASGMARVADTIVPGNLSSGDRQLLAMSESKYGNLSLKWPNAY